MNPLENSPQPRNFRAIIAEFWQRMLRRSVGASFLFSLVFVSLLYRGMLCFSLYTELAIPPNYSKQVPLLYFWKYIRNDFLIGSIALCVVVITGFLLGCCVKKIRRPLAMTLSVMKHLLANAVLLVAALVMLLHYHLLFEVNSGVTAALLRQGFQQLGAGNFWAMVTVRDLAFVLSPLLVFCLAYLGGPRFNKGALLCCLAGLVVAFGLQFQPRRTDVDWAIMENPVQYFVVDLVNAVKGGHLSQTSSPFVDDKKRPGPAQMHSLKLIDSAFVTPSASRQPPVFPAAPQGKWNVLFVVMESTGAEYVFDPSFSAEVPMPFLHRLSKEGLTLVNHYSTSNYSPKAAFSLFTGLYCRPDPYEFSTHARACVPTFNTFIGRDYHCFFVTPTSTSFFFPLALLINNGMRDIYDKDSIPLHTRPQLNPLALHESDCVDFLLEKLDKTPEPFFAVYWSYIPHWPYADGGEKFRIAHSANAKQDLYYNNLRALDAEIERIFDHLKATGKLQNTILVFVGDHGEGFGRHVNAMMHGIGTFDETYKAPAVFYQPALFAPRQVDWATSHVDILPTLLDAMGVKFPDDVVQGESVLRGEPDRKYVFTISAGSDFLSAIDRSSVKVSLSLVSPEGYAYDLRKDPLETKRLPLDSFPAQVDAITKFRTYQYETLGRYNQCLWEKRRWEADGKRQDDAKH